MPSSQYEAGTASVTSIVNVMEKVFFHQSNCMPDINFFDNLSDWMLANACKATLEWKLSLFQCHPDACDAMLA